MALAAASLRMVREVLGQTKLIAALTQNDTDWTVLRDRWEHSYVVPAGLGLLSLTLLAAAVTV
jgi:hypothetical protein